MKKGKVHPSKKNWNNWNWNARLVLLLLKDRKTIEYNHAVPVPIVPIKNRMVNISFLILLFIYNYLIFNYLYIWYREKKGFGIVEKNNWNNWNWNARPVNSPLKGRKTIGYKRAAPWADRLRLRLNLKNRYPITSGSPFLSSIIN